jgi:DNA-binding winged helix-turn-helix (wHTH) protein/TolB-like protein/tetratricopeptide (TPR) repeat protein
MPTKEDLIKGFTIGDWEVYPGRGILRRGEQEERPEPKVFEVLLALACRDGELVTRDDLIGDVWGGRATTDEPINRCLSQLRGHLDDRARPHHYVETLQRRGYRLMKPVTLHHPGELQTTQEQAVPGRSPRLWKIVVVVMALGFLASIALTMRPWGVDTEIRSIAVLPIENLSGDPANQYIMDGIKNVLARRLSEVPGLSIKNTRVHYNEEPSRIAKMLDVDGVLSGAVQLQDSTLKVTYLIARGRDNVTIESGEVNGDLAGIFALQERLANEVLDGLSPSSTVASAPTYTPNAEAYNRYMRGMYALDHRGEAKYLEKAVMLFQESIRRDEKFGPAYLALATSYALMPYYRNLPVLETDRAAIQTVEQGIAVDPTIRAAAGAVYGSHYHQQKMWSESEAAYRLATNAPVADSIAFNWYSRMLNSVGRLDEALVQALKAEAIDPDNGVVNSRVAIVYTWLGDAEKAHDYFARADDLGGTSTIHNLAHGLLLIREGRMADAEKMAEMAFRMSNVRTDWIQPVFAAFEDPATAATALDVLTQTAAGEGLKPEVEVTARTMLGDTDGAMAVARRLEEPGEFFQMDLLFAPELQALRDHPDFMPLLKRLGVVDYWKEAGCEFDGQKAVCQSD